MKPMDEKMLHELVSAVVKRMSSEDVVNDGGFSPAFEKVDDAVEISVKAQRKWQFEYSLDKKKFIIDSLKADLLPQVEAFSSLALKDTGMGNLKDKIMKNRLAIEKTPGPEFIRTSCTTGDEGLVLEEHAPFGVIASITPSTNPTASVINNTICMLSAGNSVVFAPHPGAAESSIDMVQRVHDSLISHGAPEGIITVLSRISMENVGALMSHHAVRLVSATGGPGVVNAALSSGKPAIGAGPGNPPVVVDETAHVEQAAKDIVVGCSFDNNLPCTSEKALIVVNCVADQLKRKMLEEGAFELKDPAKIEALKEVALNEKRTDPNRKFVGKDAVWILEKIGIKAPGNVRLILVECELDDPIIQVEMLMPVLGMVRVPDFDAALEAAIKTEHGFRHSALIHSTNVDHMSVMAKVMETTMFTKNGPSFSTLGFGGECPTAFTIATTTGQGPTTPLSFCRLRRCNLHGSFRIV